MICQQIYEDPDGQISKQLEQVGFIKILNFVIYQYSPNFFLKYFDIRIKKACSVD